MRLNFGAKPWIYPQPVFVIGTYDEEGNANVMTCVWGGQTSDEEICLCLREDHATTKNILNKKEFTVSLATEEYMAAADFVGLVSAKNYGSKLENAGFTVEPAQFVDAPLVKELPAAFECRLIGYDETNGHVFGQVINLAMEKSVLGPNGKPDPKKLKPIMYDPANQTYWTMGEKIGKAFSVGKALR